jgi:protein tyrosine/serine phosphatase
MSQQLCPPEMFGIVEPNVYRSNLFFPISFPFIKLLNLKTVLLLSAEVPTKVVCNFLEENNITLVHLGSRSLTTETSWKPMSEELVKDGLEWVLDKKSHPLLVCDTSGIHQVGILIGCLRRLQNWSLSAIIHEYRIFAASKARYVNEQFIELFDVDLVTLPEDLPDWFREHLELEAKEKEEYQQLYKRKELDPLGILVSHISYFLWFSNQN